jgi:putative IMPACT (imprinted ancient) family translation regulator
MKRVLLFLVFVFPMNGMEKSPNVPDDIAKQYFAALCWLTETDAQTGKIFKWIDYINYKNHPKYGALITRYKDAIIEKACSDRLITAGIGVAKESLNENGRKLFYVLTGKENGIISSEEWLKQWTNIKNELMKDTNSE